MTFGISKEAVIYCRVSNQKQTVAGDGLRSQETRCREFARMKGYEVLRVFTDDVSGSLTDRPGMSSMLTFLRKQKAENTAVLIDDVSRLARGLQAHFELRSLIDSAGGTLESPSIEFGEDSDSILVENLLASVSQHQRQKNGEQTKNRMRSRAQNGYWVFHAPVGFRYQRVTGRGMMLVPNEPVASVIREAIEGYASGRFETQAEMKHFLQRSPLYPRDKSGIVKHQRVTDILNSPLYAGYIEVPNWGVSLRPAQHEGLVSFQTYQRVQERLSGGVYAPRQKNVNEDFPLRGFVACADCGRSLTACWSKGSHARHPYYLCPQRDCPNYGKSIRRATIEGEFATLLQRVQPGEAMFKLASRMFRDQWNHRLGKGEAEAKALKTQLGKVEAQVDQLLERILLASVPSVIRAYEERVRMLEMEKANIREALASAGRPKSSFDATLRTALAFLANPCKLWSSDRLEDKRTVLKLTFANKLRYARGEGFRTAELSLPFNMMNRFSGAEREMARWGGFEPPTP